MDFKYKDYSVKIWADESAENPREWDNVGTMVCFHKKYTLGDEHKMTPVELAKFVKNKQIISLPLYLYDHSGLSISTESFVGRAQHAEWDSGQIGYIYITRKYAREVLRCGRLSEYYMDKIVKALKDEVAIYNHYISDQIYGFTVYKPNGDELTGYGGFYGDEFDTNGLLNEVKIIINNQILLYG